VFKRSTLHNVSADGYRLGRLPGHRMWKEKECQENYGVKRTYQSLAS